jgi:hypothetical protein
MRTHEYRNKIEKIMGFCERGNECESGDNKFCSTELRHLVFLHVVIDVSVKLSTLTFTVEVPYES